MPRVAFSFNISDEAVFFAHYDILTQRPTSNNRFSPVDYFFIEARDNLISNPNLRLRRPSTTNWASSRFEQDLELEDLSFLQGNA